MLKAPIKDLSQYSIDGCHLCVDSTAEFADISVGGIGSDKGWTTVVLRSETGEVFFNESLKSGCIEAKPLTEDGHSKVIKFNKLKRKQVEENSQGSFPRGSI